MEKGWSARGLLRPLWERLPGKRDELAKLTGITPQTLSAYNSGSRDLGIRNARRIAAALEISVLELGAPLEEADQAGQTVLGLLQGLAATVDDLLATVDDLKETIEELQRRPAAPRRAREGR